MENNIKTLFLLVALTAIMVFMGNLIGGQQGMIVAFIMAMGMNFFSYWFSDKMVLRMYNAQEVEPAQAPELHQIVEELAREAGVPKPKVYVVPTESPNAFATGRNPEHAVVAVTQGILRLLTPTELKGVLAHEMGHVQHRDILIQTVAATLAGAIMIVANTAQWGAMSGAGSSQEGEGGGGMGNLGLLVMAIMAPFAAMLIQMAISRSREYLADQAGARFSTAPSPWPAPWKSWPTASRQPPCRPARPRSPCSSSTL